MSWPEVLGEFDTIRELLRGRSLARNGDGECKIAHGSGYSREPANERLTHELRQVIHDPHPACLVGIPTMDQAGPKFENWTRHKRRFEQLLNPAIQYGSAFVTRPDSAPWIEVREFGELVQSLWAGKRVAVVCERKGSMMRAVKMLSRSALHIECPKFEAYAQISRLQREVEAFAPEIAVLSAGPTATCLAHRLAARGIQAIDMGSAGKFLLRVLA